MKRIIYPKYLRKALNLMNEEFDNLQRSRSSVAAYGRVIGPTIEISSSTICHINLHFPPEAPGEVDWVFTCIQDVSRKEQDLCTTDEKKRLISWLANHSPLSRAFHSKHVGQMFEDRFIIFNTDVNKDYMCHAVIATRMISEFGGELCRRWNDLVSLGIDKRVAYVLAHTFSVDLEGGCIQLSPYNSHTALDGTAGINQMILAVGMHSRIHKDLYKHEKSYENIAGFFVQNPLPHIPLTQIIKGGEGGEFIFGAAHKRAGLYSFKGTYKLEQLYKLEELMLGKVYV